MIFDSIAAFNSNSILKTIFNFSCKLSSGDSLDIPDMISLIIMTSKMDVLSNNLLETKDFLIKINFNIK